MIRAVRGFEQPERSGAHGFRSHLPRSLLTLRKFCRIRANYGSNPELAARRLRSLPTTAGAVEEAIKRQADMGVDEFILRPCAEELDQMERLAELAERLGATK